MKKVEITTGIHTTPERIISAFTDPGMLKKWWGVDRTLIDRRPGGLYTLAWGISDRGLGFVSTGIIKEYIPDGLLKVENFVYLNPDKPFLGPMALTVRVKDNSGITELYLCQDGYLEGPEWDWYYEAVKEAWPAVLRDLKGYLERMDK